MLTILRAIVLVAAVVINSFCLMIVVRRWIISKQVEHALAMAMHGTRFLMSCLWIAIVQDIVTSGTPAGIVSLFMLALMFLVLTVFALVMVIKGI